MSRRARPSRVPTRQPGADLHVHTTHSDGLCSPGEVVRAAAFAGLDALAITDHDTLTAIGPAAVEARRLGIELIPGIELTVRRLGRTYHVLGYYVRPDDPDLTTAVNALREGRTDRIDRMIESLRHAGFRISRRDVTAAFPRVLGRRTLAEYLVATGQASDSRRVFQEWLGEGLPAFEPAPAIDWIEGLALIRGAGGVAALAHPPYDFRFGDLTEWKSAGLGAIEVEGPGIRSGHTVRWSAWGAELDLVTVGGSDFHAAGRPGARVGSIVTPPDRLAALRARTT